jgi:hypothetical protein
VNAIHDGRIAEFLADLHASVAEVRERHAAGAAGAYGTVE